MLKFKFILLPIAILFFSACGTEELIDYATDLTSDTDDSAVGVIIPGVPMSVHQIVYDSGIRFG